MAAEFAAVGFGEVTVIIMSFYGLLIFEILAIWDNSILLNMGFCRQAEIVLSLVCADFQEPVEMIPRFFTE